MSNYSSTPGLSLEAERGGGISDDDVDNSNDDNNTAPPLDSRVISIVKSCPNYTIRPAKLAAELGMSVNDACAELCGLLSIVSGGHDGAYFTFEESDAAVVSSLSSSTTTTTRQKGPMTMVFVFPSDFEQRAVRRRRREDLKQMVQDSFYIFIKVMKIITAFGLILSLFIVCIAAITMLIVAIVALSRGGGQQDGNHHRTMLMRQLRSIFFTIRQLLWCYALFGADMDGEHPFLSEMAYDMAFLSSICFASPMSWYFWLRASQFRRRRRRYARGWRIMNNNQQQNRNYDVMDSEIEGVTLLRRRQGSADGDGDDGGGDWNTNHLPNPNHPVVEGGGQYKGLLSVAVEFLFGPSPFHPGPSATDIWKLRAMAIIHLSSKNQQQAGQDGGVVGTCASVSLEELCPYMDHPPTSIQQISKIVAGTLPIVAHFNGIPAPSLPERPKQQQQQQQQQQQEQIQETTTEIKDETTTTESSQSQQQQSKARFVFPELLSEGTSVTMRYLDDVLAKDCNENHNDNNETSWQSLLYVNDDDNDEIYLPHQSSPNNKIGSSYHRRDKNNNNNNNNNHNNNNNNNNHPNHDVFQTHLKERQYKLTTLQRKQFYHCILLGTLNLIGVIWLRSSLQPGGLLITNLPQVYSFLRFLKRTLVPLLLFYAILFFVLPCGRFLLIVSLNYFRTKRNQQRQMLATELSFQSNKGKYSTMIDQLTALGCDKTEAMRALMQSNYNIELAADQLLSR